MKLQYGGGARLISTNIKDFTSSKLALPHTFTFITNMYSDGSSVVTQII